jgi:hypothetical protein
MECPHVSHLQHLQPVRQEARRDLLLESRKHKAVSLMRQIPSIGPIRAALLRCPTLPTALTNQCQTQLDYRRKQRGAYSVPSCSHPVNPWGATLREKFRLHPTQPSARF